MRHLRLPFTHITRIALTSALVTGGLVLATAGPAGAVACSVRWQPTVDWGAGYQVQITLTPGAAVTSWRADFDLPPGQVVGFAAYAGLAQSGSHVTLTNASFNGNLPAGSSVMVLLSVNTNLTGTNAPPAGFVVNGQTCAFTPPPRIIASTFRPTVPEGGAATVSVSLSQAPPADIVVGVGGGSQNGVITTSPATLTFTAANWNLPQTLTLRSTEDADATAQTGTFTLSQRNWTTPSFQTAVLMATQVDND
jgi:hypothetical protein